MAWTMVVLCLFPSERIMGSLSLCPEMEAEDTALCLEEDFLEQLKRKYCRRVQVRGRIGFPRVGRERSSHHYITRTLQNCPITFFYLLNIWHELAKALNK